jgi:hypothetical protein
VKTREIPRYPMRHEPAWLRGLSRICGSEVRENPEGRSGSISRGLGGHRNGRMASNAALLGFSDAGQPIRAALQPGQPARQGRESSLGVRRDGATGFLRREQIRLTLRIALQFRARFEPDSDGFMRMSGQTGLPCDQWLRPSSPHEALPAYARGQRVVSAESTGSV